MSTALAAVCGIHDTRCGSRCPPAASTSAQSQQARVLHSQRSPTLHSTGDDRPEQAGSGGRRAWDRSIRWCRDHDGPHSAASQSWSWAQQAWYPGIAAFQSLPPRPAPPRPGHGCQAPSASARRRSAGRGVLAGPAPGASGCVSGARRGWRCRWRERESCRCCRCELHSAWVLGDVTFCFRARRSPSTATPCSGETG